ncbi:hypothetical protein KI387_003187, partial [Taxus chinensis]
TFSSGASKKKLSMETIKVQFSTTIGTHGSTSSSLLPATGGGSGGIGGSSSGGYGGSGGR